MEDRAINLGFSAQYRLQAAQHPQFYLGRVTAQYKDLYKVATETSEVYAEIPGKLRYAADQSEDYPTVGDFVLIDRQDEKHGNAIIHQILSRRSVFIRRAAGTANKSQVVAANIDTVFICMALNNDFNLRRLERYLAIAWDSGATPVVVLTKSDLCRDLENKLRKIDHVAAGADVIVTSGITEDGYLEIVKYIKPGRTIAFIGSSGVGKSTLINRLLGEEMLPTREIRNDDKGRHATTKRELFLIPGGGAVIDTPGMRELGVESVDLARTFAEIDELAQQCKFTDCKHANEPGCAVKQAIMEGLIEEDRLQSYNKLKKEAKYDGLQSRQIEKEKMNEMFAEFDGMKNARDFIKSKRTKS